MWRKKQTATAPNPRYKYEVEPHRFFSWCTEDVASTLNRGVRCDRVLCPKWSGGTVGTVEQTSDGVAGEARGGFEACRGTREETIGIRGSGGGVEKVEVRHFLFKPDPLFFFLTSRSAIYDAQCGELKKIAWHTHTKKLVYSR